MRLAAETVAANPMERAMVVRRMTSLCNVDLFRGRVLVVVLRFRWMKVPREILNFWTW